MKSRKLIFLPSEPSMKEGLIPKDNHVNKGMSMVWKILIVVALALGAGGVRVFTNLRRR